MNRGLWINRLYRNIEAKIEEIALERCTPASSMQPWSPKALNTVGIRSKAILLSSAALANVRLEMEDAQGQYFAGKRRVGISLWSWTCMTRSLRCHIWYSKHSFLGFLRTGSNIIIMWVQLSKCHEFRGFLCAIGLSHFV